MIKTYNWHRYWLPADSSVYLDEDAYLPDPTHKYLVDLNPGVADLVKMADHPCKILLGESGMGKSSALRADFERLKEGWTDGHDRSALIDIGAVTSITDLRSQIEDDPTVRAWRSAGRGIINLHIDSLDEAIPAFGGIAKPLMEVVADFGREHLRVSIACRTGEFPLYLQNALASHFGADNVTRWNLAPLTRGNIQIACADNGVEYEDFMQAIWEGNLQPMAARPITLDLLLRAARSGGDSIKDVRALYERGCRELIGEHPASSRATQPRDLDSDQRMAVAGRVACVTVLGARMTVNAETNAESQPGVITTREIAGDVEIANGNSFAVTETGVVEVLRTGLFAATGVRFRWSHKSYSEFMAAWHIRASGMPTRNKVALITSGRRVPAALRGIAGWLVSLDAEVFSEILSMDPEAMLHADLSLATNDQKAEVVNWLLRQGERDSPLIHESGISFRYRSLKHPGLADQLRRVIERSPSGCARYCAIQIAHACREVSLQPMLADLALGAGEAIGLRIVAASSVADHGDTDTKARLLPLALQSSPAEHDQRLQAQALEAVWPQSCSWADLRDNVGRSDYSLTTGIGRFIGYELPEAMKPEDWPAALTWLSSQDYQMHGTSAWVACGDRILEKAARANDAGANSAIVHLLHCRLSKHEKMFGPHEDSPGYEPWPEDVRRSVAAGLVPRLVPDVYAAVAMVRGERALLSRGDLDFAVGMWSVASAPEKTLWQAIVGKLVDWDCPSEVDAALAKAQTSPALHDYLYSCQRSVQSQRARECQNAIKRDEYRRTTREKRISQIRELLLKARTDHRFFWNLLYTMAFPLDEESGYPPRVPIHSLPGWEILSAEERDRLIEAGKLFVNDATPRTMLASRRGILTNYSVAGYCVFFELITKEPSYLESLPEDVWKRWAPAIVLVQCGTWNTENATVDEALVTLTVRKAPFAAIKALSIAIPTGRNREVVAVMCVMAGTVSGQEFDERVLRALCFRKTLPATYRAGMRMLVERGYWKAVRVIEDTLGRIDVAPDSELPQLGLNAVLLLHYNGFHIWNEMWKKLQARPSFAAHLLNAFGPSGVGAELAERLSDDELTVLYIWLRNTFGANPEPAAFGGRPEWVAQGTILTALQRRVRPESVSALECLVRELPDEWDVRRCAWDARRQWLDSCWTPLAPGLVKRVVADPRQMIVRDEEELADAVWQSLIDYQTSIRGEGSLVMTLWNESPHTPKSEVSISLTIARELEKLLRGRGVSVTCETEISPGQYVDLYMTAVTPDARKLTLIVEVKGCWHKELMNSLETQLAGRYLRDNQSRHAIYLVVWFLCDRWNGEEDSRKRTTRKTTSAKLREDLELQAQRVSAMKNVHIRAFVLDATIEGPSPKPRDNRKRSVKKTAKRA